MDANSSIMFCFGLSVDWVTFTTDFRGLSAMYSNVLGPRYEGPCTKIPISPSTASESFLVNLDKVCKVSCLPVSVRLCCADVLPVPLLCSATLFLIRVIFEPFQIGSTLVRDRLSKR